jgi:hypothetical protein
VVPKLAWSWSFENAKSIVKSVVKFVLFDLHFICTVELYPYGPRPQLVSLKKLLTPDCCLLQDGFTAAEKSGQEPPEERTLQVLFFENFLASHGS